MDETGFAARLRQAVLELDGARAKAVAEQALAAGEDARLMIERVVTPTAEEIGKKFERDEFFLPQLILAGEALEQAMNVLLAAVPRAERKSRTVVVIGTVKGDIHTIGKNIVAMVLRTAGFEVHDLGIDVSAETFISEAVAKGASIIAASSLLTTTLPYQRELIEELRRKGLRERFKVLIGGGPSSRKWAEEIGADGHGVDAVEAVAEARRLTGGGAGR